MSHVQPVNQLHPTAVAENRFVFDKSAPFEPARESVASKDSGPVAPSTVDPSIESSPDSIETSHHENHLREHHHGDPIAENGLPRGASVHLGDSFHFKQHGSDGSGDIAPAPWHAAVESYAIRDGALHGHHSELSAGWTILRTRPVITNMLASPTDSGRRRCLNRPRRILIRFTAQAQLTPTCRTI
ncbi:hypothetical protein ACQ5SK_02285 [Bradyrhizobium japonicum]